MWHFINDTRDSLLYKVLTLLLYVAVYCAVYRSYKSNDIKELIVLVAWVICLFIYDAERNIVAAIRNKK